LLDFIKNEKDFLTGHIEDLSAKAVKSGRTASRFLTPAEARGIASRFAHRRDIILNFDGGYDGAERVRAVLLNPDCGSYERKKFFVALKIEFSRHETLGHRDILGAVMALGIERNTVGDITESPLALICLPELSEYIINNFIKAGRAGVKLSKIDLKELKAKDENLIIKTHTVASLRLDAVLSASFGIPRGKAVGFIEAGRVSLNYEPCLNHSKEVGEGSIMSVRGFGRAKLLEIGGVSKKERIFIKIGLYG
jgi:RNA-binding protein YlmH